MDAHLLHTALEACEEPITKRAAAMLVARGARLTPGEIAEIDRCRATQLVQTERVEFDPWGPSMLLEELAAASFVNPNAFVEAALPTLEIFYELRSHAPVSIDDEEIALAIVDALDKEEGTAERVDWTSVLDALMEAGYAPATTEPGAPPLPPEAYSVTDDEGKTYRWEGAEWAYDEFACGWDGEKWEDAHE
ncbi:DUF6323 family protein [uncultured Slackia sp.]|uniref:DUF6323 family protein n=1 Tax=uncultured Slackia sp. TaxID=665903 RepID=UPI002583746B|nr:DUF6323 family protein [uncultured Slackia sp.]